MSVSYPYRQQPSKTVNNRRFRTVKNHPYLQIPSKTVKTVNNRQRPSNTVISRQTPSNAVMCPPRSYFKPLICKGGFCELPTGAFPGALQGALPGARRATLCSNTCSSDASQCHGETSPSLVAGKNFPPENDSDYSASRTRMVTVLDAYESSVHGLSYAVSFVSILGGIWVIEFRKICSTTIFAFLISIAVSKTLYS